MLNALQCLLRNQNKHLLHQKGGGGGGEGEEVVDHSRETFSNNSPNSTVFPLIYIQGDNFMATGSICSHTQRQT